jgi:hypothetical protein
MEYALEGSVFRSASQADVQAYAALAQQIGASASAYGTAAATTIDPSSCLSTHASYDAQVRPMVDRMRAMSGAMDDEWGDWGTTRTRTCPAVPRHARRARAPRRGRLHLHGHVGEP